MAAGLNPSATRTCPFGTNTRILRLNDYDFGEGTVPTVSYTTLPQFIHGVASTATANFPTAPNERFNFLRSAFQMIFERSSLDPDSLTSRPRKCFVQNPGCTLIVSTRPCEAKI